MARIDVETKVTAPSQINVPLVRADYKQTSDIFRIAFEVFLTFTSMLVGHVLSIHTHNVYKITWVFLVVCVLAAIAFLACSFMFSNKAKDI